MTRHEKETPKPLAEGDEWLTAGEAALRMKYKVETLYMWARTGLKGPPVYGAGKDRRYKKSEIDIWMQRSRRETADTLAGKPVAADCMA
ncbi:MAG: helix-turn-helix domain-containing protein [Planctomycetota bacterium]